MLSLFRHHWPRLLIPVVLLFYLFLFLAVFLYWNSGTETYWLLFAVDFHHPANAFWDSIAWLVIIAFALASLWEGIWLWSSRHLIAVSVLLIAMVVTWFMVTTMLAAFRPYAHLSSTTLDGQVYHLTKYTTYNDDSLLLFQCDFTGWWCQSVRYTNILAYDPQHDHTYQLRSDMSHHAVIISIDNQPYATFYP